MAKTNSFYFPSADGVHQIHVTEWIPDCPPRAVVQIVHGLSDYTGRYDRFGRFLAGQGFLVCGGDHLGHGKTAQTDGVYGWFAEKDGWNKVLQDVRTLWEIQREKYPDIPYILYGHSMGSFLTRHYLLRWPGTLSGAVLSGTAMEPLPLVRGGRLLTSALVKAGKGKQRNKLVLALALGSYNKSFRPTRTPVDWISRDRATQDGYMADPLCRFTPTNGMFHDMLEGLLVIGNPHNLSPMDKDIPYFFLSGNSDPVGNMGKGVVQVYDMFKAAGCTDVTLKLYKDARHETLNEINFDQVHRDVLNWLDRKFKTG